MPNLGNPADPFSEEYGKNFVLSELIQLWFAEKVDPDGLVVALTKSAAPAEAGFRIYRVNPATGLTPEFDKDLRAPATTAFPGCTPIRISVPPRTRDIITFTGIASDRIATHRYGTDRSLALLKTDFYTGVIPSDSSFNGDGSVMYIADFGNPNRVQRLNRDLSSGATSLANGSGYPFSVGCGPVSIRTSNRDDLIFTVSSSGSPVGIFAFKNTGSNSGALTPQSPYDPSDNPSQNNNLCILENERLLYMTSGNATNPIYGMRYDADGNLSLLPNSPFSPDPSYAGPGSADNLATTLTLDPRGKYLAFLYSAGGTFYLRLLGIDTATGNLIPTDQKLSVGNAPRHLEWDRSGSFIYLVSDTGGTMNVFQLEYFKYTPDGKLERGINSPITISAMSNGYNPMHIKSIPKFYQ